MRSGNRSKKVRVWVRIRPSQNCTSDFIEVDKENNLLKLKRPRKNDHGVSNNQKSEWEFKTDGVFDNETQQDVYESLGAEMINSGLSGVNATIMCYGQTGAGKTFTITGATEVFQNRGLVPRALHHLFKEIETKSDIAVTVRISYLEIYNDIIVDLLEKMPNNQDSNGLLVISEDNGVIHVKGLKDHLAQSEGEALNLLFEGETNRVTAAHALNTNSSRSHTIFTIYLETRSRFQSESKYTQSKLNFVDLAGSERLRKTQSSGTTLQEASYINKSLSFLEQTVIALAERNRDHIPYRQSKLTYYLKDSIGGSCKTILIANIWGDDNQVDETVSTMRFAQRMRCVASEPVQNQQHDPQILVRNLKNEIIALRKELLMQNTLINNGSVSYEPISEQQRSEMHNTVEKFLRKEIDEINLVSVRQIETLFSIFRDFYWSAHQEANSQKRVQAEDTSVELEVHSQAQSASAGQISTEGVGDLDGRSFGVTAKSNVALDESSIFLQNRRKEAKRSRQQNVSSAADSHIGIAGPSVSPTKETETNDVHIEQKSQNDTRKASSPPMKSVAFEEFKRERGSEINRILIENKVTLSDKKREYAVLANQVNASKTEIDRTRLRLDALRVERERQGNAFTEEGELIITEEEFVEIKKLHELKESYKANFEKLKDLKTQIAYCQKMIELTRQKLMQEFDHWYTDSFLDIEKPDSHTELEREKFQVQNYEDPYDNYDRTNPYKYESNFGRKEYSRAKESTDFRESFTKAGKQARVQKQRDGAPIIQQLNQPPSRLEIF